MVKSLDEALKELLKDKEMITMYEATVLHEIIMEDGVVSPEERALLEEALKTNKFDEKAYALLSQLLTGPI